MVTASLGEGFEQRTASIQGVRIAYRVGGDPAGPPVLLWHGFLGTSFAWRKVAAPLADAGCAVLVPDMRGYGDSDKPAGADGYDGASLAEEFRALVQSTGFGDGRPLTLVAHDMGAPPALLWAGTYPDEADALHYVEEPVFLPDQLREHIAYTPEGTKLGGLWWWFMAFAPDLPEALIVGNEERFLRWFYTHYTADPSSIDDAAVQEYLRTFRGVEGVLGALGVYRAAFTTADQTRRLTETKLRVPVFGYGGAGSQGDQVGESLKALATEVRTITVPDCGHFIPEEAPDPLVRQVLASIRAR